jgi:hypothetical protein
MFSSAFSYANLKWCAGCNDGGKLIICDRCEFPRCFSCLGIPEEESIGDGVIFLCITCHKKDNELKSTPYFVSKHLSGPPSKV